MTIEELIEEVYRLAKENPDFCYTSLRRCYYIANNTHPSCIFGQALLNLGVSKETLKTADEYQNTGKDIIGVLDMLNIEYNDNQRVWCKGIQRFQDNGFPWSYCIKFIDELQK